MMIKEQIAQKEKFHAYLDHCNSTHTMVTRILRTEYLTEFPAHWQCCSHPARYCHHPHRLKRVRGCVNPRPGGDQGGGQD